MPMKGFTDSPYPAYVRALIARRPSVSTVEADDPSLFGEIDKTTPEVKIVKANGNGNKAAENGKSEAPSAPVSDLPPIQQQVNQKRGRGKAARV
jgi:hypothetical protein